MANEYIDKIKVNGQTYEVRDAKLLEEADNLKAISEHLEIDESSTKITANGSDVKIEIWDDGVYIGDSDETSTYINPVDGINKVSSGLATAGKVLTADGNGGSSWESPAGGGTQLYKHQFTYSPSQGVFVTVIFYSNDSESFCKNYGSGYSMPSLANFINVRIGSGILLKALSPSGSGYKHLVIETDNDGLTTTQYEIPADLSNITDTVTPL